MFDGVLTGPEGRCGLRSCSDIESPSTDGTLSKVAVAPRLEPRGREGKLVVVHGEIVAGWDGGEDEIEEGIGFWPS